MLTCMVRVQKGHRFSNHVPSKSQTIEPDHRPQPMSRYTTAHQAILPSKDNEQQGALLCLKLCPAREFSFTPAH